MASTPAFVSNSIITKLAFRNRFTLEEKVAIEVAKETNPVIRVFSDDILVAQDIDLDNSDLISGVNYLEHIGLIATGRASQILAKS